MRCLYSCVPRALKLQTVSHTGVSRLNLRTPVLTVGLHILSVLYIELSSQPFLVRQLSHFSFYQYKSVLCLHTMLGNRHLCEAVGGPAALMNLKIKLFEALIPLQSHSDTRHWHLQVLVFLLINSPGQNNKAQRSLKACYKGQFFL